MTAKCQCNFRTRLVGDGCQYCNPSLAAEYENENSLVAAANGSPVVHSWQQTPYASLLPRCGATRRARLPWEMFTGWQGNLNFRLCQHCLKAGYIPANEITTAINQPEVSRDIKSR